MNYSELQAAILGDTHKSNYAAEVPRFIRQGEALIRSKLEAYQLSYTFLDAHRIAPESNIYLLPLYVSLVRYVQPSATGAPLAKVDEPSIALYRSSASVQMYALRPKQILFAGTPAPGSELPMQYFGMPTPLANPTDTNALITDYPQLYIEAASVYVFKRAQDYESAAAAQDSVIGLLNTINRQVKKMIGGAQSVNTYNTAFRSSY